MLLDTEYHDVFISYAREDSDWVREHLLTPLLKCRSAAQDSDAQLRPPRIFFDVGEDGVQIGQDFMGAIADAIQKAKNIVPVYSQAYFRKKMCQYELSLACNRHVLADHLVMLPILIDDGARNEVPNKVSPINYWPVSDPEWFGKLCQALDLRKSTEELTLNFLDQPGDVFLNHTLPVVRVAVQLDGQPAKFDEEIAVQATNGTLLGTTTVTTRDGIAAFDDLSVADVAGETQLIARAPSVGECLSEPFTVFSRTNWNQVETKLPDRGGQVIIPATGEVVFFATGRHMAVIQPDRIMAYSIDGKVILTEPVLIRAPIRLIRRSAGQLVLADWQGNILLIRDDGSHTEWKFGASASGFTVPADVDIEGDQIYVSFWSGSVFLLKDGGQAELVIKDDAGIQAIGVYKEHFFTCDFGGMLRVYRDRRLVNTATVESTIWSLKGTPSCLVGVGDRKFYHISEAAAQVIHFDMPLDDIASVYELSDLPIVIDTQGKGIRFNSALEINTTVYTQPGAEPVSADDAGIYCIFCNPDGTRTLLMRDRIVFSHADGCLAVNPQGEAFALGNQSSIQLYSESALQDLISREVTEVGHTE